VPAPNPGCTCVLLSFAKSDGCRFRQVSVFPEQIRLAVICLILHPLSLLLLIPVWCKIRNPSADALKVDVCSVRKQLTNEAIVAPTQHPHKVRCIFRKQSFELTCNNCCPCHLIQFNRINVSQADCYRCVCVVLKGKAVSVVTCGSNDLCGLEDEVFITCLVMLPQELRITLSPNRS
jgi:hypothetical protein